MKPWFAAIGVGLALAALPPTSLAQPVTEAQRNKALVLAFYKLALEEKHPGDAFARYAAPDFLEHSQDSAGGAAADTVTFLNAIIARDPQGRWEVIRSAADGDLVFLQSRYLPAPKGPEIAVVEIFRVRAGKLAEHWDVISGPPDKVTNANSRF
jgi:predicted SnoaL-like aldol condensation-catalyzing enzyme